MAQGVLTQPAVLSATEVLAKHHENYVPPELGEKMQKVHKPKGIDSEKLNVKTERHRQENERAKSLYRMRKSCTCFKISSSARMLQQHAQHEELKSNNVQLTPLEQSI